MANTPDFIELHEEDLSEDLAELADLMTFPVKVPVTYRRGADVAYEMEAAYNGTDPDDY